MAAINAMLFKLANEIMAAIFANDCPHGSAAFWPGQSGGEVNMDFWCGYPFFGSRGLDVNKGNLLNEDHHSVF
jgi:hypothetical protein